MRRGSKKTEAVLERIVEGISAGVPLRELCRQDGMPNWRTVYDWLEADEDFAARFGRARDMGFDAIAEEALEIADDGTNDWVERQQANGASGPALDKEHVQRSKLRIETRLKLLAKWSPKKYGERSQVDVGNKDGETLRVDNSAENSALALQLAEALRTSGKKK